MADENNIVDGAQTAAAEARPEAAFADAQQQHRGHGHGVKAPVGDQRHAAARPGHRRAGSL